MPSFLSKFLRSDLLVWGYPFIAILIAAFSLPLPDSQYVKPRPFSFGVYPRVLGVSSLQGLLRKGVKENKTLEDFSFKITAI